METGGLWFRVLMSKVQSGSRTSVRGGCGSFKGLGGVNGIGVGGHLEECVSAFNLQWACCSITQ